MKKLWLFDILLNLKRWKRYNCRQCKNNLGLRSPILDMLEMLETQILATCMHIVKTIIGNCMYIHRTVYSNRQIWMRQKPDVYLSIINCFFSNLKSKNKDPDRKGGTIINYKDLNLYAKINHFFELSIQKIILISFFSICLWMWKTKTMILG